MAIEVGMARILTDTPEKKDRSRKIIFDGHRKKLNQLELAELAVGLSVHSFVCPSGSPLYSACSINSEFIYKPNQLIFFYFSILFIGNANC